MTFGIATRNTNNFVNLDENLRAYVYLGKYPGYQYDFNGTIIEPGGMVERDVYCVGFPLVFISLGADLQQPTLIESIVPRGGNIWRVKAWGPANYKLRVFGRLDLNFPNGSGVTWGLQVFNEQAALIFDSGKQMLNLAGYTNGPVAVPNSEVDTTVGLPFGLDGTSVACHAMSRFVKYASFETGDPESPFENTSDFYARGLVYGHPTPNALTVTSILIGTVRSLGAGGQNGYVSLGQVTQFVPQFIHDSDYP